MFSTLAGEGCLLSETTLDPQLTSTLLLVSSVLYCTEGPFDNLQTSLKPLYHHLSLLLNLRRRNKDFSGLQCCHTVYSIVQQFRLQLWDAMQCAIPACLSVRYYA